MCDPCLPVVSLRPPHHDTRNRMRPRPQPRDAISQLGEDAGDAPAAQEESGKEDPVEAERRYREMIVAEPEKHEARVGLARALFAQGKYDEIPTILGPVGSGGEAGAESDS